MFGLILLAHCLEADGNFPAKTRGTVLKLKDCYVDKAPSHVVLLTPIKDDPIAQYDERICAVHSPRYKRRDLFMQNWQQTLYFRGMPMDKNLI